MVEYLIGVDGGGSGTRARLAQAGGRVVASGRAGPSGLMHGIAAAWRAVDAAVADAYAQVPHLAVAPRQRVAIGLGLAGVHNPQWAASFLAHNPGYAAVALDSDAYTTLLGAHQGQPGAIVAVGTGSVGEALLPDGQRRSVGGWGFPAGDEAGGAWIGLRAIGHMQQVQDGRRAGAAFASAIAQACGGGRAAIQAWLASASQTSYAQLAPLVVAHGGSDAAAAAILAEAGAQVALIAAALDPGATLALALCGGLAAPLLDYVPAPLRARLTAPHGDAAAGALHLIARHVALAAPC